MPSWTTIMSWGACMAATGCAFVAPSGQQTTALRAIGNVEGSQFAGHTGSIHSSPISGVAAAMATVLGVAVAGLADRRARKRRTSLEVVGVGIKGFGSTGRQVASIAMHVKDSEKEGDEEEDAAAQNSVLTKDETGAYRFKVEVPASGGGGGGGAKAKAVTKKTTTSQGSDDVASFLMQS
eukprot:TRINITY_DN9845_c0_g2_i3.p1 TRINITY_DN9845_c0_g2~~TRINITY_DN9845_c0_g2_i3.p1  ORF type:complete len:180 (+),score=56.43 TRINITY_DN9845_c0_g2_i3:59-598(+)